MKLNSLQFEIIKSNLNTKIASNTSIPPNHHDKFKYSVMEIYQEKFHKQIVTYIAFNLHGFE